MVSGGAGAFTIPTFLCGETAGREFCSGDHHYLVFDVTTESLTMEAWGATPEPNDRFDIMTITIAAIVIGIAVIGSSPHHLLGAIPNGALLCALTPSR